MLSALVKFNSIPKIGFAHHFYTDTYCFSYEKMEKSIEIVYVKSGGIEAELYGQKQYIPERSVFVLFRHLPITLKSIDGKPQSHCTVQAEFEYDFSLITEPCEIKRENGFLLPFVVLPCNETEEIKRELYSIVSDMGISRSENGFSSSIRFLNIMLKLDRLAKQENQNKESASSIIIYKVKQYVAKNINKDISLPEIGKSLSLSHNYINQVFKNGVGIPIKQYVNSEKIKKIAELMQKQGLSFKTACANVGLEDISYGYRLFKKHMGVTPGKFLSGDTHNKTDSR